VLDRVLDTTVGILAERGYAFSVDEVALGAGVHKTTIYRRWPTKAALVGAAAGRLAAIEVPDRRTGDPLADLTGLALDVARLLRSAAGQGVLRAVLAAAGDDPQMVVAARQLLTGRYQRAIDVIEAGIEAGTLRDDIDPTIVWESIVNPLHVRAILGAPASDDVCRQLVGLALEGAAVPVAGAPH
jgi:AcrR family transcriptional regulator